MGADASSADRQHLRYVNLIAILLEVVAAAYTPTGSGLHTNGHAVAHGAD